MKHNIRQRQLDRNGLMTTKIVKVEGDLGSGRFDKNGKEIFEGDLIKNSNYNPNDYMDTPNYIVVYDEATASFVFRDPVLHKNSCAPFPNDDLATFDGELEVVGHVDD